MWIALNSKKVNMGKIRVTENAFDLILKYTIY